MAVAISALGQRRDRFDTIILSPGAPSYNQFKNFEERGTALRRSSAARPSPPARPDDHQGKS
jgi:UDP-N-acetylmuramoylalanine-D-glutamate ligase